MSEYVLDRGYPYVDWISATRAREIFDAAALDPDAQLDGTLEDGFRYVIGERGDEHLVRAWVRPVRAAEPD